MKKIILCAGHNSAGVFPPHLKDTGAIPAYEKTCEAYEAQKIVMQAANWLTRNGVSVNDIVVCDFTLNLAGKIKWFNKLNFANSVLIEVHFNSSTDKEVTGVETWYLSGFDSQLKSAKTFQQSVAQTLGLRDRGTKGDLLNRWGRLGILRDTKTFANSPKLLVEIGFISNQSDLAIARERGALAIGKAALLLAKQ